ncbi:MAG: hypothetical protein JST04_03500 [Bdellovibrionales bacterium]|nr:hypothetical protein [Bdellovibrionales bacterium]
MKNFKSILALTLSTATAAIAGQTPDTIKQMTGDAVTAIPAALVENVVEAADERGEMEARAAVLTVYTGPIVAPFTAYVKVFDPIPQEGGDYGSFKVFKIPRMLNDWPKRLKVQYARDGKAIYVGFDSNFVSGWSRAAEPTYTKARLITKFTIANPISEGAVADTAEVTVRK